MARITFTCSQCGKKTEVEKESYLEVLKKYVYTYKCGHTFLSAEKVEVEVKAEQLVSADGKFTAFPYQAEGVKFIRETGFRCLLADEMGLGKTAQALLAIKDKLAELAPVLFIVKQSTVYQWNKQWELWMGKEIDPPFWVHSSEGLIFPDENYIMSHSLLSRKKIVDKLAKCKIKTIIVDEAHQFKNTGTAMTKELYRLVEILNVQNIVLLTGTPIKNRADEFFVPLNLVAPNKFQNFENFKRVWLEQDKKGRWSRIAEWKYLQFVDMTKRFILRREEKDVFPDRPKRHTYPTWITIEDEDFRESYNAHLDLFANFENQGPVSAMEILGWLTKLRHMTALAKLPEVLDIIREYLENTENKIVIGAHHKDVIASLTMALKKYGAISLSGEDSAEEKEWLKQHFIANPDCRVLVMNSLSGGTGVDGLQEVCHRGFVVERQWNFTDEEQFEKRLDRTGQKYPVTFEYVNAEGTIDQYFHDMVEEKKEIFLHTTGGYQFTSDFDGLKSFAESVSRRRL